MESSYSRQLASLCWKKLKKEETEEIFSFFLDSLPVYCILSPLLLILLVGLVHKNWFSIFFLGFISEIYESNCKCRLSIKENAFCIRPHFSSASLLSFLCKCEIFYIPINHVGDQMSLSALVFNMLLSKTFL